MKPGLQLALILNIEECLLTRLSIHLPNKSSCPQPLTDVPGLYVINGSAHHLERKWFVVKGFARPAGLLLSCQEKRVRTGEVNQITPPVSVGTSTSVFFKKVPQALKCLI